MLWTARRQPPANWHREHGDGCAKHPHPRALIVTADAHWWRRGWRRCRRETSMAS